MAETERGFRVEEGEGTTIKGRSMQECAHAALDALIEGMKKAGADGSQAYFTWKCRTGHEHNIKVGIYDMTDEEPCDACAGTGVKGSEEGHESHNAGGH